MMIIIDDDIRMSEKIKNALKANHIENILTFVSTHDCPMDYVMNADLIFLDIEMPDESGIEFAKRIRQSIPDKKIIFISSHDEYVYDTFIVQPFFFIRKTDFEHDFIRAMYVYKTDLQRNKKHLIIKYEGKLIKIEYGSIIYIEKYKDKVQLYLKDKTPIIINKSLRNLHDELNDSFIMINRSMIINLYHLTKIEDIYAIMTSGIKLEISRRKRTLVTEALYNYIRGL